VTSNHLGLATRPAKPESDLSMKSQPMMTGVGKYARLDMFSSRVLKILGFCWIRSENQGTRSKDQRFQLQEI